MRRTFLAAFIFLSLAPMGAVGQPSPVSAGKPLDWLFVYKFNTKGFPAFAERAVRACPFGRRSVAHESGFGQQYVVASKAGGNYSHLESGEACLGDTTNVGLYNYNPGDEPYLFGFSRGQPAFRVHSGS